MSEQAVSAPQPIHTIVFHEPPLHPDEHFIDWLRTDFPVAEEKYPGIASAKIEFWGTGGGTPDGRTAEEWEKKGVLVFGVGGGRFDEHGTLSRQRKRQECASSLFVKDLGLNHDLALWGMLQYVKDNDLTGAKYSDNGEWDFSSMIRTLYYGSRKYQLCDFQKILEQAQLVFRSRYRERRDFGEAMEEFNKNASIEEVLVADGNVRMATIVSDNELIHKAATTEKCGQVEIVVVQRSTGHVQIFISHSVRLDLRNVLRLLRMYERTAKGELQLVTDWRELEREGSLVGYEEWYGHSDFAILNGSLTAINVPPTRQSLEQIKGIVRWVDTDYLQPNRACSGEQKVCDHSNQNPCPLYTLGLIQCRRVRGRARELAERK